MIVYRQWKKNMYPKPWAAGDSWTYEGWFLLGLLPLYIRRVGVK